MKTALVGRSESVIPVGARLAPEGEKFSDTPVKRPGKQARGRSLNASSDASSLAAGGDVGDGVTDSLGPISVTRATTKITLDDRDLAEDPSAHLGDLVVDDEGKRKRLRRCGGADSCSACRFREVATRVQFDAMRAANALVHELWRIDAAALDRHMLEHRRPPKGGEWPFPKIADEPSAAYRFLRRRVPEMQSGSASQLARDVERKWSGTRYDALVRGVKSPPHYKVGLPLPVRAQEYAKRLKKLDDGRFGLDFSLTSGKHAGGAEFKFRVRPRDSHQAELFEMLTQKTVKIGSMQVMQDPRKRSKWYARISYTRQVPRAEGAVSAAVNRGLVCFLTAVTSAGEARQYSGADIEGGLRAIQARRKRYQQAARFAKGGHGTQRLIRRIQILEAKGERWRATLCQQIARSYADWLASRGVSRLYMEDFSGIRDSEPDAHGQRWKPIWTRIQEWPYYQLGQRLKSCCEERGIDVVERSAYYISQRCPHCGFEAEENLDLRRHRTKCANPACKFSADMDVVAATNLLIDGDVAAGREHPGGWGSGRPAREGQNSELAGKKGEREKKPTNGAAQTRGRSRTRA